MSYKTILALTSVESEAGSLPTVPIAQDLASRWNASLTILIMVPPLVTVVPGGVGGGAAVLNQEDKDGIAKAETLAATLSQAAADKNLTLTTIIAKESLDETLAELTSLGRLHELILLRKEQPNSPLIIETVLFETGRPCLLIPNGAPPALPLQRIMIAWDGGLQASRALHEARPLLAAAQTVEVVTISGDKKLPRNCRGRDLADLLKAYNPTVTATDLPSASNAGSLLLDHATAGSSDLIVLGAYAHSRFRQMIFGGVTSTILTDSRLPVLMAH